MVFRVVVQGQVCECIANDWFLKTGEEIIIFRNSMQELIHLVARVSIFLSIEARERLEEEIPWQRGCNGTYVLHP